MKKNRQHQKKKAIEGGKECMCVYVCVCQKVRACACISASEISKERLPEEIDEYNAKVDICT